MSVIQPYAGACYCAVSQAVRHSILLVYVRSATASASCELTP